MSWFVFIDAKWIVKPHFVSMPLKEQLTEQLSAKYSSVPSDTLCREQDQVRFEPGGYGIYAMAQPRMLLNAHGCPLEIDCAKMLDFFEALKEAKGKRFSDGTEYFKLYSRMSCLALSAGQRETLLFQASGRLAEAEERADDFFGAFKGQKEFDLYYEDPEEP